jgi:hypothetical protein
LAALWIAKYVVFALVALLSAGTHAMCSSCCCRSRRSASLGEPELETTAAGASKHLNIHRAFTELRQLTEDQLPRATASTGPQGRLSERVKLPAAAHARVAGCSRVVGHRESSAIIS